VGAESRSRRHAQMLIAGVLSTWSCEQRFEGPIARADCRHSTERTAHQHADAEQGDRIAA
jgi:hypothetical protein